MHRKSLVAPAIRLVPLGAGIAILALVTSRLGFRQLLAMLAELRWSFIPVLSLYGMHQLARAAAFMWCVRGRTVVGFAAALRIRLAGEAVESLTFTGPMLAEPMKAWLLQQAGLDLPDALAATLTEYLASMVAAAVSAVIGVSYVLAVLRPAGAVRVIAIGVVVSMSVFLSLMGVAAATRTHIATALTTMLVRRPVPRVYAVEDVIIGTVREMPRRALAILSAEFAAQGFLGLELWALMITLHVPCSLWRAALMEGVMKFMNAGAFFVPAQVGVAEGSYAVVFTVFGLPALAGVTVSLARRLRTLATALVGLFFLKARSGFGDDRHSGVAAPTGEPCSAV